MGWVGLFCRLVSWVGLGWVVLQACFVGWVGLFCSLVSWVGLGWVVSWVGLGPLATGLGWITENGPTSVSGAA